MLITLIAWIYISFLCRCWGFIFIKGIDKITRNRQPIDYGFSITCFVGLAAVAAIAQIASLFNGLSNLWIQVLFFVPAFCTFFFFEKPGNSSQKFRNFFQHTHPVILFLFAATLLMILFMSVYSIIHPDTISYHAQLIKWAERYRVIPGLVHINYLYGLQNNWFLLCGLFSFSFTGINALTFINTSVLIWLLIFLVQKINEAIKTSSHGNAAFLWLLLFFIHLCTYTQIRLTATSASPDFIATLYILLIFYICSKYENLSAAIALLIIYLCFFTLTIKLSAIPMMLLVLYLQLSFNRIKFLWSIIMAIIIIAPFLIRNAVTSGHLLYPVSFPDIIVAGWKYDTRNLDDINKYITAYARTRNDLWAAYKPFTYWIQIWWQHLYLVDKIVITAQFFSIIILVVNLKKIIAGNRLRKILIFISLAGIVFWFLKAPDPRFGAGFLLSFSALIFSGKLFKTARLLVSRRIIISASFFLAVSVCLYDAYRLTRYFKPDEFISPAGLALPYQSIYYRQIKTCIPLFNPKNKNVRIVSDTVQPAYFNFRGSTVDQGFTAKEHK